MLRFTIILVVGDMTIRGVTKPLTWMVTAQFDDDSATGHAKTSFTFSDFGIPIPRIFFIVSVDENVRLEMDYVLSIDRGS